MGDNVRFVPRAIHRIPPEIWKHIVSCGADLDIVQRITQLPTSLLADNLKQKMASAVASMNTRVKVVDAKSVVQIGLGAHLVLTYHLLNENRLFWLKKFGPRETNIFSGSIQRRLLYAWVGDETEKATFLDYEDGEILEYISD